MFHGLLTESLDVAGFSRPVFLYATLQRFRWRFSISFHPQNCVRKETRPSFHIFLLQYISKEERGRGGLLVSTLLSKVS